MTQQVPISWDDWKKEIKTWCDVYDKMEVNYIYLTNTLILEKHSLPSLWTS